jgi:succinate-semialdehyde dehydrogenase/glutarate-semialdehyde dehydrogenase
MQYRADNVARTVDDVPSGLLIGGSWGESGDWIEVLDPAHETVVAAVADAGIDEGLEAVAAAHTAGPAWAARAPRERGEVLRSAFALMSQRADALAELIVRENGKALRDARAEVAYAAEFFRWYAEEAVRNEGTLATSPSGSNRILVVHQPVGVAVLVTPWNFPAAMATRKIGPALAAGCTTVLKPASATPLTALAIGALLEEAGVPPGVVNVLPSSRSGAVVSAMLHDVRVRKLSFTGSTEVGRALLREAADCVVDCSMELGGNAPFIVFADADLDAALAGAMVAKMRNGGEACTAANRFYIEAPVAEEFSRMLAGAMANLTMGPGLEPGVDVGPLVNAATRDKVAELVEWALDDGAEVLTGGRAPDRVGYFYEPTVLTHVAPAARILGEEIFGPVAPVVAFADVETMVAQANHTEHGLVAYVYTGDLGRGLAVAEALESGMVGLNRGLVSDPAAPFGGVKQSGIGREGGHEGMLEFLESKYIAVDW